MLSRLEILEFSCTPSQRPRICSTNRWAWTNVKCYLDNDDVIDKSQYSVIEFERNELYLPRIDGQRWGHIFICTVVKSSIAPRVKIKVSYSLGNSHHKNWAGRTAEGRFTLYNHYWQQITKIYVAKILYKDSFIMTRDTVIVQTWNLPQNDRFISLKTISG